MCIGNIQLFFLGLILSAGLSFPPPKLIPKGVRDNQVTHQLSIYSTYTQLNSMSNYNTVLCVVCGGGHSEETILLCDCCDNGFHTTCLNLCAVPAGDWFCPRCIHNGPVNNYGASKAIAAAVPATPNVWIYTRVSSAGQNAPQYGRVGMESQNSTALAFAVKYGCVVKGTVREVCSARNPANLVELQKLIKKLKHGDTLLVTAVDRFSRNLNQGMQFVRQVHAKGAVVYAISESMYSNDQRFPEALKAAQAYSDALSKKMIDTFASIKARGGFVGRVAPEGYKIERDQTGLRRLVKLP